MTDKKKILIIEDDIVTRTQLKQMVEKEGYLPIESSTATDGLDKIQSISPDLIVLDMHLPDKSGTEFLMEFNKFELEIPIIGISMNFIDKKNNFLKDSYEQGVKDFLQKPIENEKFREKLIKYFSK